MSVTKRYHVVKICYYGNSYSKLNNVKTTPKQRVKHNDLTSTYINFKWKFFEHLTGITEEEHTNKYSFSAWDCAKEQLLDEFGIVIALFGGNNYSYYIPKDRADILDWITMNLPVHQYKIMKRACNPWWVELEPHPKHEREEAEKRSLKYKKIINPE